MRQSSRAGKSNRGKKSKKKKRRFPVRNVLILSVLAAAALIAVCVFTRTSGRAEDEDISGTKTAELQETGTAAAGSEEIGAEAAGAEAAASEEADPEDMESGNTESEAAAADSGTASTAESAAGGDGEAVSYEAKAELQYPERVISSGITINGIDVGGMTEQEASDLLQKDFTAYGNASISLEAGDSSRTVVVPASEFGISWNNAAIIDQAGSYGHGSNIIARYKGIRDLEHDGADLKTNLTADRNAILNAIETHCADFDEKAVEASLTRENGSFVVTGGQSGVVVNRESSADKIKKILEDGWTGQNEIIALDTQIDEPEITAEELSEVKDVLGTFTTNYSSSGSARCQNISNACGMINGTILYPGQQFSVLSTITPFSEENGYALAGSYLGSQVVESFGGGICQVSTTLYNAVIRAEMEIDERHNHSLIVSYVDPSDDAAIAESSGMDFRFTNNLEYPVYIEGYISGKSITFNVYGKETRDPGRSIAFESETLETIEPEGEAVYTDSAEAVGSITYTAAHTGYKAQLWKIVKQDGVEVSRDVFNKSTYNMAPRSCTVGTLGTMTIPLQTAINDQSIAECEAAIATLSADQAAEAAGTTVAEQQAAAAMQAQADAIAANATSAANDAYAQAIANGADEESAEAAAQTASEQVVEAAQQEIAGTTESAAEDTASQDAGGDAAQ